MEAEKTGRVFVAHLAHGVDDCRPARAFGRRGLEGTRCPCVDERVVAEAATDVEEGALAR